MICKTCKYRKGRYCCHYKVKITLFATDKTLCLAYREKRKSTESRTKRNSLKQEKKLARKLNAKLTPASGALSGTKGDMTKGYYLIESKSTRKDRITLKKEWLDKVRGQALKAGKFPVLALDFGKDRYFVVSGEDFEKIIKEE